jgi:2-methylcitrate dehydratase PrpD
VHEGILDERTYMNRRTFFDRVTQMTGSAAAAVALLSKLDNAME